MYEKEITKLKNLINHNVYDLLQKTDAILAGGCITSLFTGNEINDLDIYFRDVDKFIEFMETIEDEFTQSTLCFSNQTKRSILGISSGYQNPIQLIVYKMYPTPDNIFDDFDFTINMGAFEFKTEKFVFDSNFFKHNSQRFLSFHSGTSFPIMSGLRVQKYLEKGYTTSKNEMLKLFLTIHRLNINSWEEMKDHIGGMYGLDMDEVFAEVEKEEFSIDKTLDVLINLDIDGARPKFGNFQFETCLNTFFMQNNIGFKENARKGDDLIFKVVSVDEDGNLMSWYRSTFKYPLNEEIDGGDHGIYCNRGRDVLDNRYYKKDKKIIEIELQEGAKIDKSHTTYGHATIKGPIKVVGVYTRMEFLKSFYFDGQDPEKDCIQIDMF